LWFFHFFFSFLFFCVKVGFLVEIRKLFSIITARTTAAKVTAVLYVFMSESKEPHNQVSFACLVLVKWWSERGLKRSYTQNPVFL
jgi:hypothetical protein